VTADGHATVRMVVRIAPSLPAMLIAGQLKLESAMQLSKVRAQ
jgi:hypothetical protein